MSVAARDVAAIVADGYDVVITHGNGPQVGHIIDLFERAGSVPAPSMDVCVAQTQGAIGYAIASALDVQLALRGITRTVATVITRVSVDPDDPAWQQPSKPIGRFLSKAEAVEKRGPDKHYASIDERGWRRVVPSPQPQDILDICSIRRLVDAGTIVVAAGGGGIPVARSHSGAHGVDAVIDKDLTSGLLATALEADALVIATDVDHVSLGYGRQDARRLSSATPSELRRFAAQGEFGAGSMGPKIEAAARFVENGGRQAVITAIQSIQSALRGCAGTRVTRS